VELEGPCRIPEEREYVVEVVSREANPPPEREDPTRQQFALRTLRSYDLDGDGAMDALVPSLAPGACPHEVDYAVYVMRGECGHHVGRITGQPSLTEERHGGFFDLRATRRWAAITDPLSAPGPENVATLHEVTVPWSVRDGRYVPGQPDVSAGICHHCAMSECRTLSGPPPPREQSCHPLPREGDTCEGHGYCVISWGSPGGWSSALWCRGGRWEIENERNEP